jgi:23S rRNA (uracil747-C5)-methyltransferase
VELHPEAVACANESAELWGLRNVVFQTGDLTETRLLSSEDQGTSVPGPDLIVVNPPRRGIGAEIARSIEASAAGHVIYSSCNVGTLVRDVQSLPSFRLTRACVLDMFPHTTHYEIIVLLTRR